MSDSVSSSSPWSVAAPLTPKMSGLASPSIAVTESGITHVLYEDGEDIWHLVEDRGQWNAPVWVAGGHCPSVSAFDEDLLMVFNNEFAGNVEVYFASWQGDVWSLPRNLSYTSGSSSQPRLAVGTDSTPHAVWTDDTPGYSTVYHGHQEETYWVNRPIDNGRGESPWLAVDSQGLAHVVWQDRQAPDGLWQVYYTRGDGRYWSLPQNLSASDQQDATLPRVLLDFEDVVYVVWLESVDDVQRIYLTFKYENHWTEPETLVETSSHVDHIQVAFTAQGTLHLAWIEQGQVRHRYRSAGQVMSQIEYLGAEGDSVVGMVLSLVPEQWEAHLVWVLEHPQGRTLQHAKREPALPYKRFLPIGEVDTTASRTVSQRSEESPSA